MTCCVTKLAHLKSTTGRKQLVYWDRVLNIRTKTTFSGFSIRCAELTYIIIGSLISLANRGGLSVVMWQYKCTAPVRLRTRSAWVVRVYSVAITPVSEEARSRQDVWHSSDRPTSSDTCVCQCDFSWQILFVKSQTIFSDDKESLRINQTVIKVIIGKK